MRMPGLPRLGKGRQEPETGGPFVVFRIIWRDLVCHDRQTAQALIGIAQAGSAPRP